MKPALAAAMIMLSAALSFAHRLDEYLQATLLSVEKDRIKGQIRLTPGVAVFPIVFAEIDTDAKRVIYANRVLRDLSFAVDGDPLRLRLVSAKFAKAEEMKEGLGEIDIEFEADVPMNGGNRKLTFENRHQRQIGVYLVNCLVSRDPDIRLGPQRRNDSQSFYQLDYVQTGVTWWSGPRGFLAAMIVVMLARIAWLWCRRSMIPTRNRRSQYEREANPDSAPGQDPAPREPETRSSEPPVPDLAPSSLYSPETRLTHSRP
jgi:hypothetical protein